MTNKYLVFDGCALVLILFSTLSTIYLRGLELLINSIPSIPDTVRILLMGHHLSVVITGLFVAGTGFLILAITHVHEMLEVLRGKR